MDIATGVPGRRRAPDGLKHCSDPSSALVSVTAGCFCTARERVGFGGKVHTDFADGGLYAIRSPAAAPDSWIFNCWRGHNEQRPAASRLWRGAHFCCAWCCCPSRSMRSLRRLTSMLPRRWLLPLMAMRPVRHSNMTPAMTCACFVKSPRTPHPWSSAASCIFQHAGPRRGWMLVTATNLLR